MDLPLRLSDPGTMPMLCMDQCELINEFNKLTSHDRTEVQQLFMTCLKTSKAEQGVIIKYNNYL